MANVTAEVLKQMEAYNLDNSTLKRLRSLLNIELEKGLMKDALESADRELAEIIERAKEPEKRLRDIIHEFAEQRVEPRAITPEPEKTGLKEVIEKDMSVETTKGLTNIVQELAETKLGVTKETKAAIEKPADVAIPEVEPKKPQQVIIHPEWSTFGDDRCLDLLRTAEDIDVDRTSSNPGQQIFEKMVSGRYLAQLDWMSMIRAAERGQVFGGQRPERFDMKHVSEIEGDNDEAGGYPRITQVLQEVLGLPDYDVTAEDCTTTKYICEKVTERAVSLASTGIATLLMSFNKPNVTVGIAIESSYGKIPHMQRLLEDKTRELLDLENPELQFEFHQKEDISDEGDIVAV